MREKADRYVLDGIETAMVRRSVGFEDMVSGHYMLTGETVDCPCGWTPHTDIDGNPDVASLRFHYTHCPQAKLT